jgi:alkylation response protein AidB-like acyl-CoA dehydrogenase
VAVFARTPGEEPSLGCFLVDPTSDGWEVGERSRTMGLRASETVSVALAELRLPPEGLLGEPGLGFRYAMEALAVGRAGIAAQALGIARAAMEHAAGYALEREQFGRPIAEFGAIQEKLGEMGARIAGARALTREVGEGLEAKARGTGEETDGRTLSAMAAMAKLLATRTATWVADEAVQVFGGYGYMRDYPVEKLMRDAKGTEIYEGTSEVLRWIVAREVLRAARPG